MNKKEWWLDLPPACGVITTLNGIVIDGAPYFMKFLKNKNLKLALKGRTYNLTLIKTNDEK